ncbi:hypothetical protein [Halodesulfovibrio marinisediminis]|nr:hypothetical protein [Halodesulfovibrio marinisediminis]
MKYILLLALMAGVLFTSLGCRHHRHHHHPRKLVIIVEQSVQTAASLSA